MTNQTLENQTGRRPSPSKIIGLRRRKGGTFSYFEKERLVIGSVVSADFRLTEAGVSPLHAVLEVQGDRLFVFDLASESGTFVDGSAITSQALKSGDALKIGTVELEVTWVDPRLARKEALSLPLERGGGEGQLYLPQDLDLKEYLLEDERQVLPIFDYRPAQKTALEVILAFGETVLDVEHFVREKDVVIGPKRSLDFGIPLLLNEPKYRLVVRQGDAFTLKLDRAAMRGVVQKDGKLYSLAELDGPDVQLGRSDFAKIEIGDLAFYLSYTAAPPRLKRTQLFSRDPFFLRLYGTSLLLSLFLLVTAYRAQVPPRLDAEQVPERIATILYQPKPFIPPPPPPKPEPKPEPKVEAKIPEPPQPVKPKAAPKKIDLDQAKPKPLPNVPKNIVAKPAPKPVAAKPASQPGSGNQSGQNKAQEGAGARAKGPTGTRGERNKAPNPEKQSAAYRPSAQGGQGRGGGNSQVQDQGNVDFLKSYGGKIENILGSAGAQLGQGGEKLKGFGGFSTQGSGGLALSGSGSGGGGTAEGLGGLTDKGTGGGRVGTGKGAAGNGSGIIGGSTRVALRTGGAEEVVVMGAIDSDAVEAALNAHRDEFRLCYEREINAEHPDLAGSVSTLFVIGSSGRTTRVAVERSSIGNHNVEGCVLNVIKRIEFPQPRGGGQVTVTRTFKFNRPGG